MDVKPIIAPSLLSADFGNLKKDIQMLNRSKADWIHLDIMDGVFVPNISFGIPVVKAVRALSKKPLDTHLMIVQPERYIHAFKEAGADMLTVHWEACTHLHRTIYQIKEEGMLAGVALNPHTPVAGLEDVINDLDMVLIMSVNPGFGGQKFIPRALDKIKALREMIDRNGSEALIEVDGGVCRDNIAAIVNAGADALVAGSAVFKAENPQEEISILKNI
ncbi:MAG: ribulose-phosphate 3-epimerase [Bacteroidales bacterium]|nr:ribulose-phosphate 3-epimerase [Bacteroidales bacterium]